MCIFELFFGNLDLDFCMELGLGQGLVIFTCLYLVNIFSENKAGVSRGSHASLALAPSLPPLYRMRMCVWFSLNSPQ